MYGAGWAEGNRFGWEKFVWRLKGVCCAQCYTASVRLQLMVNTGVSVTAMVWGATVARPHVETALLHGLHSTVYSVYKTGCG